MLKNKKTLAILIPAGILLLLALGIGAYLIRPWPSDYGVFKEMRQDLEMSLVESGAALKPVSADFSGYRLKLGILYQMMFRASGLSLYLKSYQSERLQAASINQLEIGKDSGVFFDFTFMLRPVDSLSVPFFHGDALKALPGVKGALYMDFYSFSDTAGMQEFFGPRRALLEEARKQAEPYWKYKGFGELTPHLDPFKSPYRLEMLEPAKGSRAEKQRYFETALSCFKLYRRAYMESLEAWEVKATADQAMRNRESINNFVSILYEHDVAVRLGKLIFPAEDFDHYFLDGFWGTGALD